VNRSARTHRMGGGRGAWHGGQQWVARRIVELAACRPVDRSVTHGSGEGGVAKVLAEVRSTHQR
jgi:hypothetical protein